MLNYKAKFTKTFYNEIFCSCSFVYYTKKKSNLFYSLLPGVDVVTISDFTPSFLYETEVLELFPGQSIPRRSFPLGFFLAMFCPRYSFPAAFPRYVFPLFFFCQQLFSPVLFSNEEINQTETNQVKPN